MRAVWFTVRQDIRTRWRTFTFLGVILVLIAGLLHVAVGSTVQGMLLYNNLSRELNGADIWAGLTPAGVQALESGQLHLPAVAQHSPLHPVVSAVLSVGGFSTDAQVIGYTAAPIAFDRYKVVAGNALSTADPNGIVVDAGLQSNNHLFVGETVTLTSGTAIRHFTIRGFEADASHLPYPHQQPCPILVLPSVVRALSGGTTAHDGALLSVKVTNEANLAQINTMWNREIPAKYLGGTYDRLSMAGYFQQLNILTAVFQSLFVVFAVLAGWLIAGNLVTTSVLEQTRQIGIIKSLGFTNRQVSRVYFGAACAVAFVAATAGILISQPFLSVASAPMTQTMGFSHDVPYGTGLGILEVGFIVGLTFLASYVPARRARRVVITDALRYGMERPRVYGRGFLAGLTALRFGVVASLAVRELCVRPLRTISGLFTILFAISTITFSLMVVGTIDGYQRDPGLFSQYIDLTVTPSAPHDVPEVLRAVSRTPGITREVVQWYDQWQPLQNSDQHVRIQAQSYMRGASPYLIQVGRGLASVNEAIVGRGLLDATGLHVGDTFRTMIGKQWATLHIVGQFFDLNNNGLEVVVSRQTLLRYEPSASVQEVGIGLANYHQTGTVVSQLRTRLGRYASVTSNDVSMPPEALQIRNVVVWFSIILSGIALLSLFYSLLRSVLERRREIAILQSLGVRPRQVVTQVAMSGAILVSLAIVAGIPLGIALMQWMLRFVSTVMGSGVFPLPTPGGSIATVMIGIGFVAVTISLIPALRAGRVRPVEILRGE